MRHQARSSKGLAQTNVNPETRIRVKQGTILNTLSNPNQPVLLGH